MNISPWHWPPGLSEPQEALREQSIEKMLKHTSQSGPTPQSAGHVALELTRPPTDIEKRVARFLKTGSLS